MKNKLITVFECVAILLSQKWIAILNLPNREY